MHDTNPRTTDGDLGMLHPLILSPFPFSIVVRTTEKATDYGTDESRESERERARERRR